MNTHVVQGPVLICLNVFQYDLKISTFARFHQHFTAGEEKALEEYGDTGADEEPFDLYGVCHRTKYNHAEGHHGTVDHSHNAEDASHVLGFYFFLDHDSGWDVEEWDNQATDEHKSIVKPEIDRDA